MAAGSTTPGTLTDVLFEDATVGRCLVAPDDTVVRANAEWLRSTGFAPDQVVGQNILDLFPGTRDLALALHARVRAGHRVEVPRHAQDLNGHETWWEGSIEPVPMEGGTGLLITARPVRRTEFQLFYETAPVPFLVLAPDRPRFTIVAVSEAYLRATKTTRDIIGRGIFEVFPDDPSDPESTGHPARISFERVLDTGAPDTMAVQKHALRRAAPAGGGFEERYWSPINTPVLGPAGEVQYIHHRVEDVTDFVRQRHRAEVVAEMQSRTEAMEADIVRRSRELQDINRQLRIANERLLAAEPLIESEQRLRALADSMPQLAWTAQPDGYITWYNRRWYEYSGTTPAQMEGWGWVSVHDPATLPDVMRRWKASIATGTAFDMEFPLRRADGKFRRFLTRVFPMKDQEGRVIQWFGTNTDVTEIVEAQERQRASEQRLGLAFDAALAAAWEVDLVTGKHVWEDRFFPLLCVPPEHREYAEQHWSDFVLPEDRARAAQEFSAACQEGAGEYDSQFRARRMDGVVRWFRSRGVEVRDPGGGRRMVGFVQDITEQKAGEETLREANEKLREADRRKDEFLGMLSHELRNPLAPIRNSAYILEHATPGSEQARRAQSVIQRQTEHLTRLVDDLLDVTRIARGKIELRRSRIDLREVVWRAADDFHLLMADRGVKFSTAFPEAQVWADADGTRVTQIVGNLLHNASKYTRKGDEVTLALETDSHEAVIRVRDTGAGIDSGLLPRIFEAFVQGERTLARTDGGLGLGLALVKGIAELHGGHVEARSAGKGRGAEFVVRLPLLGEPAREAPSWVRSERRNGGRRVLVVDDNRDAAESLADLVTMLGHTAEVAHDGLTAIEKVRASPPDVVLCDLGLPGMSGYEVAQALRAGVLERVQLIAVSGYAQPEDVKRAVEAGFDGHVAKPCDPEKIERLLG